MDDRPDLTEPSLHVIRGGTTGAAPPALPEAPRGDALPDGLTLGDLSLLEGIGQTPLLPVRDPLGERIAAWLGRHHALLFLLCLLASWAVVTLPTPLSHGYKQGERIRRDVLAPFALELPDREETERRRLEAAALVPPQYDPNPDAQSTALFALRRNLANFQSRPAYRGVRWERVRAASEAGVRAVYLNAQVRSDVEDDLQTAARRARQSVRKAALQLRMSARETTIAANLAQAAARVPNLVVNQRETHLARRNAQRRVPAVFERIEADMPVAREGEEVSPATLERLAAIESVGPRFDARTAFSHLLICVLLLSACAVSIGQFSPRLLERPAALWMAAVVPVAFLLLFRVLLRTPHADLTMAPVAATAAMLLTVLIDARVGLAAGTLVAGLCALLARAEVGLFLTASLTAWVGALSVAEISRIASVVRASALLTIAGTLLTAALGLLRNAPPEELTSMALFGGIAGGISVGAMAVLALLLERPFGLTTHLRLLELLAPDETVLKRMQTEAPGTYTHSLMVATLAEGAAKKVGADPLLCRVGGLYHDIGKLRRPHCFIENQSGDNIHERLSPQLSALVILAHVKDGLQLGRAIKLPDPVLDMIVQHHGTSMVSFFYQRALQAAPEGREPDPTAFRYPGPRPQSKEAALVMLADSVEASARALPDPSAEKLRSHVRDMIALRLREGELSECELTLRDLSTIEDEFAHALKGALHGRIAYPTPIVETEAQRAAPVSDVAHARDWMRETVRSFGSRLPHPRGHKGDEAHASRRSRRHSSHEPSASRNGTKPTGDKPTGDKPAGDKPHGRVDAPGTTPAPTTDERERKNA